LEAVANPGERRPIPIPGERRLIPGVGEKFFPKAREKIAAGAAAFTFATVQDFFLYEQLEGAIVPIEFHVRFPFSARFPFWVREVKKLL
jgi:hypothetical protein